MQVDLTLRAVLSLIIVFYNWFLSRSSAIYDIGAESEKRFRH